MMMQKIILIITTVRNSSVKMGLFGTSYGKGTISQQGIDSFHSSLIKTRKLFISHSIHCLNCELYLTV